MSYSSGLNFFCVTRTKKYWQADFKNYNWCEFCNIDKPWILVFSLLKVFCVGAFGLIFLRAKQKIEMGAPLSDFSHNWQHYFWPEGEQCFVLFSSVVGERPANRYLMNFFIQFTILHVESQKIFWVTEMLFTRINE